MYKKKVTPKFINKNIECAKCGYTFKLGETFYKGGATSSNIYCHNCKDQIYIDIEQEEAPFTYDLVLADGKTIEVTEVL